MVDLWVFRYNVKKGTLLRPFIILFFMYLHDYSQASAGKGQRSGRDAQFSRIFPVFIAHRTHDTYCEAGNYRR